MHVLAPKRFLSVSFTQNTRSPKVTPLNGPGPLNDSMTSHQSLSA